MHDNTQCGLQRPKTLLGGLFLSNPLQREEPSPLISPITTLPLSSSSGGSNSTHVRFPFQELTVLVL